MHCTALFAEPVVEETDKTIVVTAGEIEWMQSSWQKRWNRPPTAQEFDGLIQQYIKETVLYREALTMGLNKHDQVIRRRLAQKLEFLAKDLVALTPPTEDELLAYFDEHQARYQAPTLYTFTQVFFDPDKRGDATLDDAGSRQGDIDRAGRCDRRPGCARRWLDAAELLPAKRPGRDSKNLGSGFTDTLITLAPGQWHGPVLSGFGVHLVYVNSITEPPPPVFAEVRERVVADWSLDRGEELNDKFYANLREQYTIVIEEPESGVEIATPSQQGEGSAE